MSDDDARCTDCGEPLPPRPASMPVEWRYRWPTPEMFAAWYESAPAEDQERVRTRLSWGERHRAPLP